MRFSLLIDAKAAVPPSLSKLGAVRKKNNLLIQPNADAACAQNEMYFAPKGLKILNVFMDK